MCNNYQIDSKTHRLRRRPWVCRRRRSAGSPPLRECRTERWPECTSPGGRRSCWRTSAVSSDTRWCRGSGRWASGPPHSDGTDTQTLQPLQTPGDVEGQVDERPVRLTLTAHRHTDVTAASDTRWCRGSGRWASGPPHSDGTQTHRRYSTQLANTVTASSYGAQTDCTLSYSTQI